MENVFQINGAIAIYKGEELFLGMSHYTLLKLILEEGSINAAAKRKGMSYQQAWNLIDQLNRVSPIPIVIRQKGGSGGGGCTVSNYGKAILRLFEYKIKDFNQYLEHTNMDMQKCVL